MKVTPKIIISGLSDDEETKKFNQGLAEHIKNQAVVDDQIEDTKDVVVKRMKGSAEDPTGYTLSINGTLIVDANFITLE